MYSDSDIDDAVAAGALTPESAAALRAHVSRSRPAPAVDEEHFRLITGFNDVFVVIATVLVVVAIGWIGIDLHRALGGPAVSLTSWVLAEHFTRRRHMALPSIVLLLTFVGGVFGSVCEWAMDADADLDAIVDISLREVALAAAIAAVAAWIHWRRFRVPITVAAGAAAVVGVLIALTGIANPDNGTLWTRLVMFLSGVGVFALAMRWDLSDLARRTRRSDVAFWLHLLAAPLIVNPVFSLASSDGPMGEVMSAIIVMVVYAIMGVIALTIDRRALLVSALAFLLAAINSLIQQVGALSLHTALTALIIGIALLALSAFWQRARVTIVSRLPTAWRARLPAVNA